ncbi:MAG: CoA transferase [Actinomycetota bacterium]|nr:CoA transferase [Actinomycetota bacterium]
MLPLDDVTVIEIDNWMASPSAAAILADMGADVIKVEPLTGDPMRNKMRPPKLPDHLKGYDYQFDVDNRGKRSISIDLESADGVAIVHRLCQNAQVFMCNLLAHRQVKFGLDPKALLSINPGIVHATLTGYGTTGPEAWRPGYDVTAFFGRSGIYDAMREGPDGPVPMARPAQGDHTTGLSFVGAILGGLRLAERSGVGQVVETSLYETAVWTQATDYSVTGMDRAALPPRDRHNMIIATSNRFPCGDGKWVVFNMPEEAAFWKLCRLIGKDEWLEDERFSDIRGRFRNMPEIVKGIDAALAAKGRDEWGEIFDANGIIWGPVLGLHEVADDPQAEALGMFPPIEHPEMGVYRSVAMPMKFKTADVGPRSPAPLLGEHTRSVLAQAGMTDGDINALFAGGVVR